jgi:hypothetical protein
LSRKRSTVALNQRRGLFEVALDHRRDQRPPIGEILIERARLVGWAVDGKIVLEVA